MKSYSTSEKSSGRLLITVNVLGSAGPLRFVVSENDKVATVVGTALKKYGGEGRLPVLSSDINDFLLYSATAGVDGKYKLKLILSISFFFLTALKLEFEAYEFGI